MIFSATLGDKQVCIALLLKHKSCKEPHIHFQLNRYLLNAWDDQLTQKKPLLPVIPIVIYHRRRWKKRDVSLYFDQLPAAALSYVPSFDRAGRTIFPHVTYLPNLGHPTIELVTIFSDVSKQAENYSISLYDQLIQEGVEKGIEAGIDQTNRKAIRAMLTLNMEKAMIASALELPIEQVDRYIEQLNPSKR
nr:hypothetical protein A6C57_12900 [Fibrella sp. ES10-3-2-2]